MKQLQMSERGNRPLRSSGQRAVGLALVLALVTLSACGNKEKKSGQALASVDGAEITVLQLNEEMTRSGVQAGQQEAASKQLLEALIDRQLLQNEGLKDKIDRDPKVVQSIERAKSLIIAQAYLQKRAGAPVRPTEQEVNDYFDKNPAFFAQRKVLDMRQLVLASKDVSAELKAAIDGAKNLEEVAAWLDSNKVRYARAQVARSTSDLPPELGSKLLAMNKGQLFIVKEGERTLLISIAEIKDAPVTREQAKPQIEQFLVNKKSKDVATAEVARLRAAAKIEYLNQKDKPAVAPAAADADASATARGVAGLK